MKSIPLLILMVLLTGFTVGCKKDDPSPTKKEPKEIQLAEKASEVIQRSNGFGLELFKAVAAEDAAENLMISPLSASAALTMLLNGCDEETYNQIQEMLGFQDLTTEEINESYNSLVTQLLDADEEVTLALANAVWYRNGFQVKNTYIETMQSAFDATIEGLDFSTAGALETINQWASDNTNGKIPVVLNEISGDAVMFLMNALYFKGIWTTQFKPENTYNALFYPDEGSAFNTPTMHGSIPAKAIQNEAYKALELFYGRKNFSMIIVVPEEDLASFNQLLDASLWHEISGGLDATGGLTEYEVAMPKFSFEYEKFFNDQLQALGMVDAFVPSTADLSGITDEDVFVSFVKQNTFVEVNEEGTEAAAVTTIGVELTSLGEQFVVDKPFIFAIREQTTNTILFIGQLFNP